MATLKKVIAEIELDKLFNVFNTKYFHDDVKKPIIAVQTNGKNSRVMGWCTTNKCWSDKEKNENYYEITICAEYLFRGIEEICSTLLHEMVHLYNLQHDIKDTSRGNVYHNKKFKESAEKCGLSISYNNSIGWSVTELNNDGRKFVKSLDIDENAFTLSRQLNCFDAGSGNGSGSDGSTSTPPATKPTQSSRKYVCPVCGTIVRATKEVNIVCGDCDEIMTRCI